MEEGEEKMRSRGPAIIMKSFLPHHGEAKMIQQSKASGGNTWVFCSRKFPLFLLLYGIF